MIRYLKYEDIDKEKWDDCIRRSFNGNLYGYSWFLDVVAEYWEGLIEDEYERVFPLTQNKKFGIHYLYQPFFTQQLGIFSKNILSKEIVTEFIKAIPDKFKYVEILLNAFNKVDESRFKVLPMINHELDLIKPYPGHLKSFSKNTKRNIKKAENEGIVIARNVKPESIIEMFRNNRGKDISRLGDMEYRRLKRLFYTCIYKGAGETFGAMNKHNELCAGAFFARANRKAIFLFSGMTSDGRDASAMFGIMNEFIKIHANSHLTLDFDGSNDPNLARFYKGFGSRKIDYSKLIINKLPFCINVPYKLMRRIRGS